LAGGVGPENVGGAKKAGAFGVDLNSRVETFPGIKDAALVERCMEILRGG
jgi:indole-3-glycerol phosphate synthase/phosphoribosylanthranilate isomerase